MEEMEQKQVGRDEFEEGRPEFAGDCFGFDLDKSEPGNPQLTMYVEDDGTWFIKAQFASFWIDDIQTQLQKAKEAL